jgi:uncharacterized membrane protein
MAPYFNNSVSNQIRLMCALCYMSMGIIGLIYMLFNGKDCKTPFFQFHFIQALMIGIFMTLVAWTGAGISGFVMGVLGLFGSGAMGAASVVAMGLGLLSKLIETVAMIGNIFGIIQSARGKYADMPVVSKLVRANLR